MPRCPESRFRPDRRTVKESRAMSDYLTELGGWVETLRFDSLAASTVAATDSCCSTRSAPSSPGARAGERATRRARCRALRARHAPRSSATRAGGWLLGRPQQRDGRRRARNGRGQPARRRPSRHPRDPGRARGRRGAGSRAGPCSGDRRRLRDRLAARRRDHGASERPLARHLGNDQHGGGRRQSCRVPRPATCAPS